LTESYGEESDQGKEIFNIPFKDLAEVTEISVDETTKIMEKLDEKGWIKIDSANNVIYLVNFKQLINLAGKV
jgi:DNA-binding Lrp family transcriptional regulator